MFFDIKYFFTKPCVETILTMKFGLIVDLETTGLDCSNDKIIEIGILKISIDEDYRTNLIASYSELEDPKKPLPSIIEKITGLNDSLLKDRKINWERVREYFQESSFVIAHNMPFDRSFLEHIDLLKELPIHWVCSQRHIDWKKHGFKSQALNYLACDHGFVNPFAHRALFDCATTFRLIAPYMKELLTKSYETTYELMANGAPFSLKDNLKDRGYLWNQEKKVWFKHVFESDLKEEQEFLIRDIYAGKPLYEERKILKL